MCPGPRRVQGTAHYPHARGAARRRTRVAPTGCDVDRDTVACPSPAGARSTASLPRRGQARARPYANNADGGAARPAPPGRRVFTRAPACACGGCATPFGVAPTRRTCMRLPERPRGGGDGASCRSRDSVARQPVVHRPPSTTAVPCRGQACLTCPPARAGKRTRACGADGRGTPAPYRTGRGRTPISVPTSGGVDRRGTRVPPHFRPSPAPCGRGGTERQRGGVRSVGAMSVADGRLPIAHRHPIDHGLPVGVRRA